MKARDPLTYRYPRTLAELEDDERAWWTTAEAAAAEEDHIRAQLAGKQADVPPMSRTEWTVFALKVLVLALGSAALYVGWERVQ